MLNYLVRRLAYGVLVLLGVVVRGRQAGAAWLALWCVSASVVALCQPALALTYPKHQAGRALSAFNLMIFLGVFSCQWGMGLVIDALVTAGWTRTNAHRAAMGLLLLGMTAAGVWYWAHPWLRRRRHSAATRR